MLPNLGRQQNIHSHIIKYTVKKKTDLVTKLETGVQSKLPATKGPLLLTFHWTPLSSPPSPKWKNMKWKDYKRWYVVSNDDLRNSGHEKLQINQPLVPPIKYYIILYMWRYTTNLFIGQMILLLAELEKKVKKCCFFWLAKVEIAS